MSGEVREGVRVRRAARLRQGGQAHQLQSVLLHENYHGVAARRTGGAWLPISASREAVLVGAAGEVEYHWREAG